MKYSELDLFEFMDSEKNICVTDTDGKKRTGRCWAYSSVFNEVEDGISEPSIEVQDTVLYLHEIEKIEYSD